MAQISEEAIDLLEAQVDAVIGRSQDPGRPTIAGPPIFTFGTRNRKREFMGVPCACHRVRAGWICHLDATALKRSIEYYRLEFVGVSLGSGK